MICQICQREVGAGPRDSNECGVHRGESVGRCPFDSRKKLAFHIGLVLFLVMLGTACIYKAIQNEHECANRVSAIGGRAATIRGIGCVAVFQNGTIKVPKHGSPN